MSQSYDPWLPESYSFWWHRARRALRWSRSHAAANPERVLLVAALLERRAQLEVRAWWDRLRRHYEASSDRLCEISCRESPFLRMLRAQPTVPADPSPPRPVEFVRASTNLLKPEPPDPFT